MQPQTKEVRRLEQTRGQRAERAKRVDDERGGEEEGDVEVEQEGQELIRDLRGCARERVGWRDAGWRADFVAK